MLEYLQAIITGRGYSERRQITFPEFLALIGGALPEVLGYLKRSCASPADIRRVFAPLETAYRLPAIFVPFSEHHAATILSDIAQICSTLGDWAVGRFGPVSDDQLVEFTETFRFALSGQMLASTVRSYQDTPEAIALDILSYLKTGVQPNIGKVKNAC